MKLRINQYISVALTIVLAFSLMCAPVKADANSVRVVGNKYSFHEDTPLKIGNEYDKSKTSDANALGVLNLTADKKVTAKSDNGVDFYTESTAVAIEYTIKPEYVKESETGWYLIKCKEDEIDNIELDNKIGKGTFLVQASLDGEIWTTVETKQNVYKENGDKKTVYTINGIQLQNGCHLRVTFAYKMERVVGKNDYIIVETDRKEQYQALEVYEFYIENNLKIESDKVSSEPKYQLGQRVRTDDNYNPLEKTDKYNPHASWDLGNFYISGYTEHKVEYGKDVFLKSNGDKIKLRFNLLQDISDIKGDGDLYINNQKKGSDDGFEIQNMVFKRGLFLIQKTNTQNEKEQLVKYTDFLAACCSTGADTTVSLFEEGKYVVALDYELMDESKTPDKKTHYQIKFEFEIKNNKSMLYIRDSGSQSELMNYSYTKNGFYIDLANSQNIKVSFDYYTIKYNSKLNKVEKTVTDNGYLKEKVDQKKVGVYVCKSINDSTKEDSISGGVERTIYVGDDKYVKALSSYELPLDDAIKALNDDLKAGKKVNDNGEIK